MANQTGKRYVCASCGSEMLVTRGGDGELACCNQPMTIRGATSTQQAPEAQQSPKEASRG